MKKLVGRFFVMDVPDERDPNPERPCAFPWWLMVILVPMAAYGIFFILSFFYNVFIK